MASVSDRPSKRTDRGRQTAQGGLPSFFYAGRWVPPPLWRETRVAREYLRLVRDPIFEGRGVPDGEGRPVLLIPGFLAGDNSLSVLHAWLRRVGYEPQVTGINLNLRYSEMVVKVLETRLVDLFAWSGRRVVLLGHSRGGILAKVLSHRHPEMVAQVVTLGSPLGDPYDVHPVTMAGVRMAQAVNFFIYRRTARVETRFLRDLAAPVRVPVTSIYSRTDGIVHWEACLRPDVATLEVHGSHVGLGVNVEVYSILGWLLQPASGSDGRSRRKPRARR